MITAQTIAAHASSELDTALEDIACFGPELANGMTSHAPMVAEALEALGRPDQIGAWIERNRPTLRPWPPTSIAIDDWCAALGDWQRVSDWRAFFNDELADGDWRGIVARWVPRLAAGASAHAMHGLIRTAHAVRSLGRAATDARLGELAAALASWAAAYADLPIAPETEGLPVTSAAVALARLSFLPAERRNNGGSIVAAVAQLSVDDDYARAFHWPLIEDAQTAARSFGILFAQVFTANVDSTLHAIVFTHGVTGCAAARHLVPLLAEADARALVRHVWHASCALYAAYGSNPPAVAAFANAPLTKLIDRAVTSGDDHAIKLAEAVIALELPPGLASVTVLQALRHL
jgi:Questin oxidase-like